MQKDSSIWVLCQEIDCPLSTLLRKMLAIRRLSKSIMTRFWKGVLTSEMLVGLPCLGRDNNSPAFNNEDRPIGFSFDLNPVPPKVCEAEPMLTL